MNPIKCLEKNETKGKVSVIVPVYNVEQYLDECIKSILDQTYSDLQILLLDDGSSDNSFEICEKWEQLDDRIMLEHHDNKGVSYTRNRGLSLATGDFVMFLDSDDYILPDMVEKFMNHIKDSDIVCGPIERFTDDHTELFVGYDDSLVSSQEAALEVFKSKNLFVWGRLYARKAIYCNKQPGSFIRFNEHLSYAEDVEWLMRVFTQISRVSYTSEGIYRYRYNRGDSAMTVMYSQYNEKYILSALAAYESAYNTLLRCRYSAYKVAYKMKIVHQRRYIDFLLRLKCSQQDVNKNIKILFDEIFFYGGMKVGVRGYLFVYKSLVMGAFYKIRNTKITLKDRR